MKKETNFLVVMPLFRENLEETYIFALGIPYISAAIKKAGFSTYTLNLNHIENPYDYLQQKIMEWKIDVILSGGNSPQYGEMKALFGAAKSVHPSITTVCGGGVISSDATSAMKAFEVVDIGVIGEGEVTIVELCQALSEGIDISGIAGLIHGDMGEYRLTTKRKELRDIDTLAWPDYEGFNFKEFLKVSFIGTNGMNFSKAAMILTSRSCPYSCTFCFHTSGRRYRQRNLDDVFKEIDYLVRTYEIGFLYVLDELFSLSEARVKEFCKRIKKYNLYWNASFRVDGISPKILDYLKLGNCFSISFGIESADNSILESMKKQITIEQIEAALEMCHRAGMNITGSLIFGDKNETAETANTSLLWWKENTEYNIHLKMITPFPGTELYRHACENNIIDDPVKYLKEGCPPINVSKMTDDEMGEVVKNVTMLPYECNTKVVDLKMDGIRYENAICDLSGCCAKCGTHNIWQNTVLFTASYLICSSCNESLAIDVPPEIVDYIDLNIKKLHGRQIEVGLWGMANYAVSYLDKSTTVADGRSVLIDWSPTKQLMMINSKRVFGPNVIKERMLGVVVVLVPHFFAAIKTYIEENYKHTRVVSVYDLFDPNFTF